MPACRLSKGPNIEADPNPAPLTSDPTCRRRRHPAEEMERHHTIPMEIVLSPTPGIPDLSSTSFHCGELVRVTSRYGLSTLLRLIPRWQSAWSKTNQLVRLTRFRKFRESSLAPGEGLSLSGVRPIRTSGSTNLRTVQDWIRYMWNSFTATDGVVQCLVGRYHQ